MITHVTTGLPPQIDGVGDYALRLAEALRERGVESGFVLPPGQGTAPAAIAPAVDFSVRPLARRAPADLAALLEAGATATVLLHYSGYGYAPSGLCWWLAEGLRRWKAGGGRRLVTVFHELYATGLPWQRSFFTSLPQRRITRRVAHLSDAALTTSPVYARRLARWRPDLKVMVSPVFSNVGECAEPPPLAGRGPFAVVFGRPARRHRVYAALARAGAAAGLGLRRLGVERLWDIGPPMASPAAVAGLPVERLGALDASAISARLVQARAGLADYPLHVITKSGILAAYFAHGLLAVNTSTVGTLADGVVEGCQFAHPRRLADPAFDAQAVADAGLAWYRPHSLDCTAATLRSLMT